MSKNICNDDIPIISVIVPIYNVAKWLNRCLSSIQEQTFGKFECLLINDGSTDSSVEIAQKFEQEDSRFKVFNKKNGGLSDARNYGIERAKGQYIVFIDSDDFIEKRYLELLANEITKNKAQISICGFYITDENGNKLSKVNPNEPKTIVTGKEALHYVFKQNGYVNVVAWNKIYQKNLFDNIKFEKGRFYEDEYINFLLFWEVRRICLLHRPLYNYVQRKGSIVNTEITPQKIKDKNDMLIKRIYFYQDRDKDLFSCAIQTYKNWIISLNQKNATNISSEYEAYLQKQFKKMVHLDNATSLALKIQDILGYINIKMAAKIKNVLLGNKRRNQ